MITDKDIDTMLDDPEELEDQDGQEEPKADERPDEAAKVDDQEETGEQKEATPAPTPDEIIAQQKARLEELERVNNGILQAKTAAAARSQKFQQELVEAQQRAEALEKQIEVAKAAKAETETIEGNQEIDRLTVDIDDDGNAFIPADKIPANNELVKKIQALESELNQTKHTLTEAQQKRAMQESLNSFLGEKDGYKETFPVLQEQSEYLSALFDQFVADNNIQMPEDQQAAKDMAYEISTSPKFQTAFQSKYPEGDPESLMQAYLNNSKYYTRKALDALLEKKKPVSTHKPLPQGKPEPLSTVIGSNTAKETESLQEYADMDLEDFLRMSPEKERRMDRLLKEKGI